MSRVVIAVALCALAVAAVDAQNGDDPDLSRTTTQPAAGVGTIGTSTEAPTTMQNMASMNNTSTNRPRIMCPRWSDWYVAVDTVQCMTCVQLAAYRARTSSQSSCQRGSLYCGDNDNGVLPCPAECTNSTLRFHTLGGCRTGSRVDPPLTAVSPPAPPPGPPIVIVDADNATAMFRRYTHDAPVRPVSVYRQSLVKVQRHLGATFSSIIREQHTVVGPPGGLRLIVRFELLTRDYRTNQTIDTVDGAAGDYGRHAYVSVGSRGSTTPIALYPASYTFLGPQVVAAGVFDDGTSRRQRRQAGACNMTINASTTVTFSLTPDAPAGFWARPDTGEIMAAVGSVYGNVSFGLLAHYPGLDPVELQRFSFFIRPRDVDYWSYGPNGMGCLNGGVPVDVTDFDQSYTCDCGGTNHAGANCETQEWITASDIVMSNMSLWNHNQRQWAADKTYIVEPPNIGRIFLMPSNRTVDPETTWWELRCNQSGTVSANGTGMSMTWQNMSGPPRGVFIDTTTGRLSVSFTNDQVNATFRGCMLRMFIVRQNYVPFVFRHMVFNVRDADFGKRRLRMVDYAQLSDYDGDDDMYPHNRTNWSIDEAYHVAAIDVPNASIVIQSQDTNVTQPLPRSEYSELSFVMRPLPPGFFIDTTTGEMFGQLRSPGTTHSVLKVTHPAYLDGLVTNMTFNALFDDTANATNGPNGEDCDLEAQRVDGVAYDNSFTCDCTGYQKGGPNCKTELAASKNEDDSVTTTWIPIAVVVVVLLAIFGGIQWYQRRRAHQLLMQPENFEKHLAKLAEAGIIKKVDQNRPPRELERKRIILEAQLGSGNFGEVWRGTWTEDKRATLKGGWNTASSHGSHGSRLSAVASMNRVSVAIKTLKNGDNPASQDEFLREASVTWQFNHDNVVRMYGVVTSGVPYLLVLELCALGELKGYLEKGDPLDADHYSLGRLFNFLVGIAEGMQHLSELGFVHRDLAARNVLVSDTYDAKICDFGLGRETSEDSDYYRSNDANMLVPIRWTDPDVLGTGKFSEYTDVWAYGITAIEIFTRGDTPYRGWLNTYIIEQTKAGYRLPCPEGCPSEVYNSVIAPCWLPTDENASPRRPNFSILCAELKRVGAKINPRHQTVSSSAAPSASTWKENSAYAGAGSVGTGSSSMAPSDYYEYSAHASPAATLPAGAKTGTYDSGVVVSPTYEIPVPGTPPGADEPSSPAGPGTPPRGGFTSMYAPGSPRVATGSESPKGFSGVFGGKGGGEGAVEETGSASGGGGGVGAPTYTLRKDLSLGNSPSRLYSPMERRGTAGSVQLEAARQPVVESSKMVSEVVSAESDEGRVKEVTPGAKSKKTKRAKRADSEPFGFDGFDDADGGEDGYLETGL